MGQPGANAAIMAASISRRMSEMASESMMSEGGGGASSQFSPDQIVNFLKGVTGIISIQFDMDNYTLHDLENLYQLIKSSSIFSSFLGNIECDFGAGGIVFSDPEKPITMAVQHALIGKPHSPFSTVADPETKQTSVSNASQM